MEKERSWIVPVDEDADGELLLTIPDELMEQMNWKVGDVVEWVDNGDGTWGLRKLV